MNTKEAEDIAYLIRKFHRTAEEVTGRDSAMVLANIAQDICEEILKTYPKIQAWYDLWLAADEEALRGGGTQKYAQLIPEGENERL